MSWLQNLQRGSSLGVKSTIMGFSRRVASGLVLCTISWCCFADVRSEKKRPEPSPLGVVCHWAGSAWEPLEVQRPVLETLAVATPVNRQTLWFEGERSQVRIQEAKPRLALRFRLAGPSGLWVAAPEAGEFSVHLLQRQRGKRALVFSEQTPIRFVRYPGMPLLLGALGLDSLELRPVSELVAGEYSIFRGCPPDIKEAYCFAVDVSPSP